jgi:hypothetical protein
MQSSARFGANLINKPGLKVEMHVLEPGVPIYRIRAFRRQRFQALYQLFPDRAGDNALLDQHDDMGKIRGQHGFEQRLLMPCQARTIQVLNHFRRGWSR